jgi:hypothetical protein
LNPYDSEVFAIPSNKADLITKLQEFHNTEIECHNMQQYSAADQETIGQLKVMAAIPEDTDDEDDAENNNPVRDEYLVTTLLQPITVTNIIQISMPIG